MEQRFLNHVTSGLVRAFNMKPVRIVKYFVFTARFQTISGHLISALLRHVEEQMEEHLVPSLLP